MQHWAGDAQRELFEPIFNLVKDLGARPHWGKHLPPPLPAWQAHHRGQFARLGDFLELRDALDPDEVFLTRYWRDHLAIGRPPAGRRESDRPRSMPERPSLAPAARLR
jgi:D-arabinono-1,4-lactone oxidase